MTNRVPQVRGTLQGLPVPEFSEGDFSLLMKPPLWNLRKYSFTPVWRHPRATVNERVESRRFFAAGNDVGRSVDGT